ncbi:MAG: anti-sigma factor [Roseobacter sp.]
MTPDTLLSCSTVREQLPWLLNNTLTRAETNAMNDHIAQCPACAAELASERALSDQLQNLDALAFQEAASWDRMIDTLDPPARNGFLTALGEAWEKLRAQTWFSVGAPAFALAVLLVGFFAVDFNTIQAPGTFETLSTPSDSSLIGLIEVRVLPAGADAVSDLSEWMQELGLTDISGPSEAGLLRGNISEDQRVEILAALRADARVALAVTDATE